MMRKLKQIFFHLFSLIDQRLKFPTLKKGEVGIQVGFDMSSPITSDLFEMSGRVGKTGLVYGIDPDKWNHREAEKIISGGKYNNIRLIELATFSVKAKANFLFGRKSSWSQLSNIPVDETVDFSGEEVEVQLDTLDNVIEKNHIDIQSIGHVNITNNGAEYQTLVGFKRGLEQSVNLSLTIVAGRYDASGTIEDRPDYEMIISFLQTLGYRTKFRRIHQLFWWGFCVKLLINRTWVYNKRNYGIIFASKGDKPIPFYQSFS
ncbi:MAG: FkbM family methyltransferase [Bacteroidales bacterium]|nr:FkbM family methyltransferase [Bacteroidales bacterium]